MSIINSFDFTILEFWHNFAIRTNNAFGPFINFISFLGKNGWFFIFLSVLLIGFKKTRKSGISMMMALILGFLFTNVICKPLIARLRPYEFQQYIDWWIYAGKVLESDFSFPSGHVTATMASMTALFLNTNKKYGWIVFFLVLLMGTSRNYLMVHFPSDVLGGILFGGIAGLLAYKFVNKLYNYKGFKNDSILKKVLESR